MRQHHDHQAPSLLVRRNQPLIGVLTQAEGQDVVRYFADEQAADAVLKPDSLPETLRLAGAWSDLDWEQMEAELKRIRHESPPSPPIHPL